MTTRPMDTFKDQASGQEPRQSQRTLPPLTPNASLRWDVLSRLLPAKVGEVLEVGCGRGAAAARIAQRASRYVAVEPDDQSFAVAKENLRGIATVHNCMSFELPGSDTFDTICAFEVLEHIEDDAGALQEWRAKLRAGGHLVLSVPGWQDRFAAADHIAGHFRRYDPAQLKARLEEAGFVDVHVEAYGAPAGYLLEAFRNYAAKKLLADGAQDLDIAERTAGSGRLFQPNRGFTGVVTATLARPMVWAQRLFKGRGVGLVARARLPE
ncbi:class I SAM-dependent methyltransferase [Erythrobacter insulae]|uniref:Class I SAM-dependent methyltransferase n=1 Tax=Erythrobacter insulae TaxID=2584124 RepID=A0A547P8Y3_9SPHN|nr:class I SAM-dependent methyltransferase [Erythrobacter insulae]TRD10601.1 class I SAM-dependent methyltransferase [Erythrobacter insulae]